MSSATSVSSAKEMVQGQRCLQQQHVQLLCPAGSMSAQDDHLPMQSGKRTQSVALQSTQTAGALTEPSHNDTGKVTAARPAKPLARCAHRVPGHAAGVCGDRAHHRRAPILAGDHTSIAAPASPFFLSGAHRYKNTLPHCVSRTLPDWILQYKDRFKPINMYINSTGTTRADGESVSLGATCSQLTSYNLGPFSYAATC